jgi:hypothetical protein
MQLSKNVSLEEFCHSETAISKGIDNGIKDPAHLENAKRWAENVFQPIREYLNRPIKINSGYRSKALNASIPGSSNTSQHCFGEAGDLDLHDKGMAEWIISNITFDQLILEFPEKGRASWFHISYREGRNRKEVLVSVKRSGKTLYLPYSEAKELMY